MAMIEEFDSVQDFFQVGSPSYEVELCKVLMLHCKQFRIFNKFLISSFEDFCERTHPFLTNQLMTSSSPTKNIFLSFNIVFTK